MHDTPSAPTTTHGDRLTLLLLLIIGVGLRVQHSGEIEYNIDQVYPIWQAIQTFDAGQFPLAGQGTSVLFANPPLTGYLFVPVIALVRWPIAAYAVTLTLNTVAIWLAYRGVRWLLGTRPALIAAALFAVNPWIIEDSRRTWVQSLAPFFVCLVFWALVPVLTGQAKQPRRRLLIALIGLALFAHTYLLAYALVAPVALLILLFWRQIPKRQLVIGVAIFAILALLYGIGLARQWDDTSSRAENFASGESRLSAEALGHAFRLVTGSGYASQRGTRAPAGDAGWREVVTQAMHIVWSTALVIGILQAIVRLRAIPHPPTPSPITERRSQAAAPSPLSIPNGEGVRGRGLILLIWFLLPILMMSYVSRVVHPFYLHLTLPAGHALAAWGMIVMAQAINRRFLTRIRHDHILVLRRIKRGPSGAFWLIMVLIILTAGINALNTIRFAQQTAAHPGEDLPETLPLAQAQDLGELIRETRDPGMAVFSLMHEWTPVTLAGEAIRTAYTGTYGRAAVVPPAGGLYILFVRPDDPEPIIPPFAKLLDTPLILADGAMIPVLHVTPDDVRIDHPLDIPTDIDLRLLGWTLDGDLTPGENATLYTIWRVDALHPDRGTWSFLPVIKVFDAAHTQIATDQGHAVSALTWRVDDLIVQRLDLTIPEAAEGPFTMELSLFDPVRVNGGGAPGINAVFIVDAGGEIAYKAGIMLGESRP
ncbi:MAG: hypothetical protein JXA10_19905 [Anaerolineae bacterium]|nr:hypothetical protein [Anaerolineae bacterium]